MRLIPVTTDAAFPGDEDQFPYLYGADYLRLIATGKHAAYWAVADSGAALPLIIRPLRIFRFGQLIHPPLRNGQPLSPADEALFLNQLVAQLRTESKCDRLTQPTTNCVFQAAPEGAISSPFGTYRLALRDRDEVSIFAGFHTNYRNEIRAAIRLGATVRFGRDQLPVFYSLYSQTMQESSMRHETLSEMTALFDGLDQHQRILCGVVYHNDIPMGGAFIPVTAHSGHYTHGGSAEKLSPPGAVRLLHWEIIRELRRQGVGHYDFVGARLGSVEGTKLEHIQRFKARFGGELVSGQLWKIDISPTKSRLFDLAVRVRRLFPGGAPPGQGDIIDQERRKVPV